MNTIKDILYRLRCGESERQIARDLGLSRPTVHKHKVKAEMERYLEGEKELPGAEQIATVLGSSPPV